MNGHDLFYRFQFQDQLAFDQNIKTLTSHLEPFVSNYDFFLTLKFDPSQT